MILASTATDALQVALAIGVIMAFFAWAITRIFWKDARDEALAAAEHLEYAMATYPPPARGRDSPDILIPQERRTRPATLPEVAIDWDTATPEERAEAVLEVLPTHYEDSNGITSTDVAHRLGLKRNGRPVAYLVAPTLRKLVLAGTARAHWDKSSRRRRVYWKTGSPE